MSICAQAGCGDRALTLFTIATPPHLPTVLVEHLAGCFRLDFWKLLMAVLPEMLILEKSAYPE